MNILIVGAGEMGKTLGDAASRNASVRFWDRDPKRSSPMPLSSSAAWADIVIFAVPSWGLREAARALAPHLPKRTGLLSVTKGLEEKTGASADEVIAAELPGRPYGALGGPMLAEEMQRGLPSAAMLGTESAALFKKTEECFRGTHLLLERSSDPRSVAMAGVLKNIYALAIGVAEAIFDGGGNARGFLAARAIAEMLEVGRILGVRREAITGTAGLGDFIATAWSPYSRNRENGKEIAKTGVCAVRGEGLASYGAVLRRLGARRRSAPIMLALHKICGQGENTEEALIEAGIALPAKDGLHLKS